MPPLVSILIPAYAAERWIADTIRSALDQTWPNKEIIVVDDGSRDRTASIARQFGAYGVRFVVQPNQGAAAARNHAFALSSGEFIQWLDADDLLAPDKIERQMALAEAASGRLTLFSSEWGRFIYRPSKARFIPSELWCDLSPIEWLIRKLAFNKFMQTATWLVSRELSVAAGSWDTRMLSDDDGEYFCRVLLACNGVRFCPGSRVYYRSTPSSRLSHIGASDQKKEAMLLSLKLHVEYIRSLEDSERVRYACLTYLQNWIFYFYPERGDIVEQLRVIARDLGGTLSAPRMRWKYSWTVPLLGWRFAKRAQTALPRWKHLMVANWDWTLSHFEGAGLRNTRGADSARLRRTDTSGVHA